MFLNKAMQIEWMFFGFAEMMMLVKICVGKMVLVRCMMGVISSVNSVQTLCCLTCSSQTSASTLMPGYLFSSIHLISLAIKAFDVTMSKLSLEKTSE